MTATANTAIQNAVNTLARAIFTSFDLDTGAADVWPDHVELPGAAYTPAGARISFALVLNDCSEKNAAPAFIEFDEDDLQAAGYGLGEERAEAALLYLLREEGALTPALIDEYITPKFMGGGSNEHLQFASGAAIFTQSPDDCAAPDESFEVFFFSQYEDEFPLAISDPVTSWMDAPAALREATDGRYIPEETMEAFHRWISENPDITGAPEFTELTVPAWAASYLVNNDASGITEEEKAEIDAALERLSDSYNLEFLTVKDDEGEFYGYDRLTDEYGGCITGVFEVKKNARAA